MSHTIHTTTGFIIESHPYGEAGKLLSIFTRDLGLVRAVAQGIRLEKSKLRYHTQDFSMSEFSFVRGKELWRLTNAQEGFLIEKSSSSSKGHDVSQAAELINRIGLLLRRLLHGEEPHIELFEHIEATITFLDTIGTTSSEVSNEGVAKSLQLNPEQWQTLESLIVFRVFNLLGYIGSDTQLDDRLRVAPFSHELIAEIADRRLIMNNHINKAIRESHL
jgi:recombinational DNA repair protein (RecF pathway)